VHKKKQQDKIIQPINMSFYELLNKSINTKVDDKKINEKIKEKEETKKRNKSK
jgi:hypothetical protein